MAKVTTIVDLSFIDFLLAKVSKNSGDWEVEYSSLYSITHSRRETDNPLLRLLMHVVPALQTVKEKTEVAYVSQNVSNGQLYVKITVFSQEWVDIVTPIVEEYEERMAADSRELNIEIILKLSFKKSELQSNYQVEYEKTDELQEFTIKRDKFRQN